VAVGRERTGHHATATGSTRAVAFAVAGIAIVAGIIRLRVFAARRSLWFDEAAVAMNIVQRSFRALLQPLDHEQTAAPLFLWGEKVAVLVGGNTEWALRALPLVAGLLLPFAMWSVARRLLPPIEALVAVALMALSPFLIYYANEVKPYGIDALVTALLFAGALRVEEQPASRGRWLALALGGAVAIGTSIPAPFVLAAVAVFLLARPAVRGSPGFWTRAGWTVVAWAVAAGLALIVYLPLMKHDSFIGSFMQHYWGTSFLTTEAPGLKSRALNAAGGAIRTTFFDQVMWPQQLNMLMLVAIVGGVRVVMTHGLAKAALLAIPVVLLIVAAALQIYPLGDRLILFAAPITALLLAAGVTWPARLVHARWQPVLVAGAGALLLAVPVWRAGLMLREPPGRNETREMIHELVRVRTERPRPGVWLSAGSVMAWRYYTGDLEQPPLNVKPGTPLPQPDSLDSGVLIGKWPQSAEGKSKGDWGTWELRRLRSAGTECGWMLLSVLESGERELLFDAIRRSNARIASSRAAPGAELLNVCVPELPS
jgi:hypothetical protein